MASGRNIVAFISGIVFALGLGLSGMTRPDVVLGFLDVFGAWDARLLAGMMGALVLYTTLYKLVLRRRAPMLGGALQLPTRRDIDARLVTGAAVFGVGWGLAGICPGPGITGLASGSSGVVVFVVAMTAGMYGYSLFDALLSRQRVMASSVAS